MVSLPCVAGHRRGGVRRRPQQRPRRPVRRAGPLQIARRFVAAGCSARASAFDEYEVAHTWAELELWTVAPNHHMFPGIVYPDRMADLAAVFDQLGLAYSFEVELPEGTPGPWIFRSSTGR
jgi:hypothetical protein